MLQFLSNELIFEILSHFLPGLRLSVSAPHLFPWYLGEICSAWRTAFISTPQFWSTLTVHMDTCLNSPEEHLQDPNSLLELVEVALERSKNYPLFLSINMFHAVCNTSPLAMCSQNILKVLVSHSMRWRDLWIAVHESCYPILYEAKGHLYILHSINLPFASNIRQFTSDSNDFEDIFTSAPQLKRMWFRIAPNWKLDWSHVMVIHVDNLLSLDEMIPVLRKTSALEELVVLNIMDVNTSNVVFTHLPSLKMLYLPTLMPLSKLRTPALEELSIRHYSWPAGQGPDDFEMEALDVTLSSYFSTVHNLRKLAIYTTKIADAHPILAQAPDTTLELLLSGGFATQQLTHAATCQHLHKLKTISVKTRYPQEISYLLGTVKTWAQETQSGLGPFKNLSQFSVEFVPDKHHNILKPVKRLRKVVEECGIRFISRMVAESIQERMNIPPFRVS